MDIPKLTKYKITVIPLEAVEINAYCPVKGCKGLLIAKDGMAYGLGPSWWRHICNVCGAEYNMTESHPRIEHRPKKGAKL
jgi:hypothetical protein